MEEAKHIEGREAQRIEAGEEQRIEAEEAKEIEAGETSRSSRKVITFEPKFVINKGILILGFVLRLFAVFGTIGSALAMGTTHESVVSLTQLILLKANYSDLPTLM